MKKEIIILFFVSMLNINSFGQSFENNFKPNLPTLQYMSPEAASLGKYGEIPISEYTGVPQITIPLYTIKSGQLELPISLSYHASGIKVNQEATWVGLGWDLMVGGCINAHVGGDYIYFPIVPGNVDKYIPKW